MNQEKFQKQLSELNQNLQLTELQYSQLGKFYDNLVEWNKVMNLTAITEEKDVYEKHFLDSLSIVRGISPDEWKKGHKLIDVGTGAGFPGLVLAIAFPSLRVTLMDSLNKRINFLNDTIQRCEIHNAVCIHARAEELGHRKDQREQYDYAVSRAVANLSTLSEYCLPFVRIGGYFIAYKSEKINEELESGKKALKMLGGQIENNISFELPETDYHRNLLMIKKVHAAPAKYPRKAGTPSREPIGTR